MEAVAARHDEDEERFHKIQLVDQNNFQERLDSLQVSWAIYVLFLSVIFLYQAQNTLFSYAFTLANVSALKQCQKDLQACGQGFASEIHNLQEKGRRGELPGWCMEMNSHALH